MQKTKQLLQLLYPIFATTKKRLGPIWKKKLLKKKGTHKTLDETFEILSEGDTGLVTEVEGDLGLDGRGGGRQFALDVRRVDECRRQLRHLLVVTVQAAHSGRVHESRAYHVHLLDRELLVDAF